MIMENLICKTVIQILLLTAHIYINNGFKSIGLPSIDEEFARKVSAVPTFYVTSHVLSALHKEPT